MKKVVIALALICSTSSFAFDFSTTKGFYVVEDDSDCFGHRYPDNASPKILIANPGVYSQISVTPKTIDGREALYLNIRSDSRIEFNLFYNRGRYDVDGNTISLREKDTSYIGDCDLLGMDVPCYRRTEIDHSWSMTFEDDHIIYKWSHFDYSGQCRFSKRD